MIEHNGIKYYTSSDLGHELNNPTSPEMKRLTAKFRDVYKKVDDYVITDGYVQMKLYPATERGFLQVLLFKRSEKMKRTCKAWSIEAISKFLDMPEAEHIQAKENVIIGLVESKIK